MTIEDLFIWKEARIVVNVVYDMMRGSRDFGFRDQIQRAAVSIMNNIAEGFDSGSNAKFINFLKIAKGSCSEVHSMLYLCEDFGSCTSEKRTEIQNRLKQISVGIVRLIETLSTKKRQTTH